MEDYLNFLPDFRNTWKKIFFCICIDLTKVLKIEDEFVK